MTKSLGIRLFARLGILLWYNLTQLFTRKRGVVIPKYGAATEIDDALGNGNRYTLDPAKGRFDVMRHPTWVHQKIISERKVGDCDEHAVYWLYTLLDSGLADRAWLGCVYYTKVKGRGGHAVAVFEKDGQRYWADYWDPKPCTQWSWAAETASGVGGIDPYAAVLAPVRGIRRGRVLLGYGDYVKL